MDSNGKLQVIPEPPNYRKVAAIAAFNMIASLGTAMLTDVKGCLYQTHDHLTKGKEVISECVVEIPDATGAIKVYKAKMAVSMEPHEMSDQERLEAAAAGHALVPEPPPAESAGA